MMVGGRSAYDYYCCTWVMVVELALRENIPDLAVSSVTKKLGLFKCSRIENTERKERNEEN